MARPAIATRPATPPTVRRQDTELRVRQVLADAGFPARRWQLIACAYSYGADANTLDDLHSLTEPSYSDMPAVLRDLASSRHLAG